MNETFERCIEKAKSLLGEGEKRSSALYARMSMEYFVYDKVNGRFLRVTCPSNKRKELLMQPSVEMLCSDNESFNWDKQRARSV